MPQEQDLRFMQAALCAARNAAAIGEVPVGAVVVRGDEVVSTGFNRRETGRSALLHAEVEAIAGACAKLGGWRLWECELYVTLEPCPMCAGAIINARIARLIYGAADPKAGCCGSVLDLFSAPFNHHPQIAGGVLAEECAALLRDFFRAKRQQKKEAKKDLDVCE